MREQTRSNGERRWRKRKKVGLYGCRRVKIGSEYKKEMLERGRNYGEVDGIAEEGMGVRKGIAGVVEKEDERRERKYMDVEE